MVRRAELLDAAADAFIQIWRKTRANAKSHANDYRQALVDTQAEYETVLQDLLVFICDSGSDYDMVRQIRKYRTEDEYETLRNEVIQTVSWTECYHKKIQDHYTTLRRFLPDWYETIPMLAMTSDNSILKAVAHVGMHADPKVSTLPSAEIPTDFLAAKWKQRALVTHSWSDSIEMVHKAPYELGLMDAIANGLKGGTLAIDGARRYAPMTQHLIDRKEFFANYSQRLKRLGCPARAEEYYSPLRERLSESLAHFDQNYEKVQSFFRVNSRGRLSYLRSSSQKPKKRVTKLNHTLKEYMMPATIMEVLLDCHRLTGFLDLFRPMRRRQNMDTESWLRTMLATLYAYGCNCGPSQAFQATGVSKQSIVYFRRHFMGTRQLMQAASVLADAYACTGPSQYLKDPGVFMTDAMHFPTLEDSLGARHYFRNRSGKNILLYQHVTADCICLFTNALLCGVSEAIHMLTGAVNQSTGYDSTVNICDNAGRSDLICGITPFLNMEIWPRLSSRQNLKLWRGAKDWTYTNINHAIAGTIRWDLIDDSWQAMIWVLASIVEGKADPSLIADYLRARPKHPAARGFSELGKAFRTIYMIRYGMDMNLRQIVMRYTARRENWNQFGRNIFHGFGGLVREKDLKGQAEVFWFLTVVQNAIVLWNALALDNAIPKARRDKITIREEDLRHILPTMVEHINFVGQFDIDINRRPPFRLAV
jgi:TnpA family transposase